MFTHIHTCYMRVAHLVALTTHACAGASAFAAELCVCVYTHMQMYRCISRTLGRKQRLGSLWMKGEAEEGQEQPTHRAARALPVFPGCFQRRGRASRIACTWLLLSIQSKRDHKADTANSEAPFHTTSPFQSARLGLDLELTRAGLKMSRALGGRG